MLQQSQWLCVAKQEGRCSKTIKPYTCIVFSLRVNMRCVAVNACAWPTSLTCIYNLKAVYALYIAKYEMYAVRMVEGPGHSCYTKCFSNVFVVSGTAPCRSHRNVKLSEIQAYYVEKIALSCGLQMFDQLRMRCLYDLFVTTNAFTDLTWQNMTENAKGQIAGFVDFDWGANLKKDNHSQVQMFHVLIYVIRLSHLRWLILRCNRDGHEITYSECGCCHSCSLENRLCSQVNILCETADTRRNCVCHNVQARWRLGHGVGPRHQLCAQQWLVQIDWFDDTMWQPIWACRG